MNLDFDTNSIRELSEDELLVVSGGKGKTKAKAKQVLCTTVIYEDTKTGEISSVRTCTPIK